MKNLLKLSFSTLFFLMFSPSNPMHGQSFADPKLSARVIQDTSIQLIVIVQKPFQLTGKKYKKNPNLQRNYEIALDSFNQNWTAAVKTHWKLHEKPQFMSIDEVIQLQKSLPQKKRANFMVLACSGVEVHIIAAVQGNEPFSGSSFFDPFNPELYLVDSGVGLYSFEQTSMWVGDGFNADYKETSETEKLLSIPAVCARFDIGYGYPGYTELSFALNNLQLTIMRRAKDKKYKDTNQGCEGANPAILSRKTLLIPEGYTLNWNGSKTVKQITEDIIRQNYPYPFKVVQQAEIEQAVRKKNSEVAILQRSYWPSVPGTGFRAIYFWVIDPVDCNTIFSYSKPKFKGTIPLDDGKITLYDRRVKELAEPKEEKE